MRIKPYTEEGIKRVPCERCGKPSTQQWQICALNNQYVEACEACDILLNEMVLKLMMPKVANLFIRRYKARYKKHGSIKRQ